MNFEILATTIQQHYDKLNLMGVYQGDIKLGYLRPAYSNQETEVMLYIESQAKAAGLSSRWDTVGNLIVETTGKFTSWVETGSHVDTVAGGGNFDGLAGVVVGLEVLKLAQAQHTGLTHGLRLRVWRGEESSAYGTASLGAWATFGLLKPEVLERTYQGVSLAEAMKGQGANPLSIQNQTPVISQDEINGIKAHIELHIEQGNLLEKQACDIGVVTGIRGSIRQWVSIKGVFDHSGGTPMGAEYRKDANLAMATMMVKLDALLNTFNDGEPNIVQTFGMINSHEQHNQRFPVVFDNAVSKVSGFAYFSFEVRSCSPELGKVYVKQAQGLIENIASTFGVDVAFESISESNGIPELNGDIQKTTAKACEHQNRTFTKLASGAWHDVAVLAHQSKSDGSGIPTGMMFIPCREGISHSAAEYASNEQIAAGASVLAEVMLSL
ncbi:MAG: hydantoinase/carbamoylase family amidase [Ghiorsea sp.]